MMWMPKRPRLRGAGLYHHVYNRGDNRRAIFRIASDHERYLNALFRFAGKYSIDVIAYALMRWHIHLFLFDDRGCISEFMNVFHGQYAQYVNKIHNRIGHLFEARYKNKIVDVNEYGLWLSRYIHRQPCDAGLVLDPEQYRWTSYRVYLGLEENANLKMGIILDQFGTGRSTQHKAYRRFIMGDDNGPVDWDAMSASAEGIVGNEYFREAVDARLKRRGEIEKLHKDPLILVSRLLQVSPGMFKKPKGSEERALRRKAIRILCHEYRLGIRQIARMFDMAPSSVYAILSV